MNMRISKEELALRVVVRRVATGSTPFTWELHGGDSITPVHVSSERCRSMQDAYTAGQAGLADYASQRRLPKPDRSRHQAGPRALHPPVRDDLADADDELDDEEDCLQTETVDQVIDRTDVSIVSP